MRKTAVVLGFIGLALLLAACGEDPPPTQIVIVVTPTPDLGPTIAPAVTSAPASTLLPTDSSAPTQEPGSTPIRTEGPRVTATPTKSFTLPDPAFPTNVKAEVQLAEQVFEHGRMFWLRHNRQIWVMQALPEDPNRGDWFCYFDTFQEGEPEIDPSLIPPEGLVQPRRGFGKLWRNNATMQDGLGWATTPEFELTSNYTYIAGGPADSEGRLTAPGENRLTTLYNETISFFESDIRGDCMGGTWRMAQ